MKKVISKILALLTIYSLGTNALAGYFFKFNSTGRLNLPPSSVSYKNLEPDDQKRLRHLLSDKEILKALGREGKALKKTLDEYYGWGAYIKAPLSDFSNELKSVNGKLPPVLKKIKSLQSSPRKRRKLYKEIRKNDDFFYSENADPSGIPKFCENYPQIKTDEIGFYFRDEALDNDLFKGCYKKESISVELRGLTDSVAKITNYGMSKKEKRAKDYLLKFVAKEGLEGRAQYFDLYGGMPKISRELKACLKSKKRKFPEFYREASSQISSQDKRAHREIPLKKRSGSSKKARDIFINHITSRALIGHHAYKKLRKFEKRLKELRSRLHASYVKVCQYKSGWLGVQGIKSRRTGKCSSDRDNKLIAERKKIIPEIKALEKKIIRERPKLESLMKEAPTLFKMENHPKFLSFDFANFEIEPSSLLKSIVKKAKEDGLEKVFSKKIEDVESSRPQKNILEERADLMDKLAGDKDIKKKFIQFTNKIKKDSSFQKTAKKAVIAQMKNMDKSMAQICENDGQYLHHYDVLYSGIFDDVTKGAPSKKEAKKGIMDVQAGLCSLYRKSPPDKVDWTVKRVVGYGLVGTSIVAYGVGAVCTGVTLGACSPSLVISGATGAVGGLLVTSDSYDKYKQASLLTDSAKALALTKWGDIRKVLDAKNEQRDASISLGIDAAFLPLDLAGIGIIKSGKFVSVGDKAVHGVRSYSTKILKGAKRGSALRKGVKTKVIPLIQEESSQALALVRQGKKPHSNSSLEEIFEEVVGKLKESPLAQRKEMVGLDFDFSILGRKDPVKAKILNWDEGGVLLKVNGKEVRMPLETKDGGKALAQFTDDVKFAADKGSALEKSGLVIDIEARVVDEGKDAKKFMVPKKRKEMSLPSSQQKSGATSDLVEIYEEVIGKLREYPLVRRQDMVGKSIEFHLPQGGGVTKGKILRWDKNIAQLEIGGKRVIFPLNTRSLRNISSVEKAGIGRMISTSRKSSSVGKSSMGRALIELLRGIGSKGSEILEKAVGGGAKEGKDLLSHKPLLGVKKRGNLRRGKGKKGATVSVAPAGVASLKGASQEGEEAKAKEGEEEKEAEEEKTPSPEASPKMSIPPMIAPRGNPVAPTFMQTIKKNTFLKQGVY